MASREESVDVSITAALAKISALEKALAKATKVTVELNTTAALGKVKALDAAITKATANRVISFNTSKAQAQIVALNKELDKVATGRGGAVDLSTVNKGRAAQQAAQAQAVRQAEEAAAKEAAAVERSAAAQVKAEQRKAAEIQAINQRLAAFTRNQQATAEREATRASNSALANQRASLSAQLSQTRSLQNIGQTITFGLTLPIAGAAVAVSRLGFQFEDTMNRIKILTTPALRTSQKAIDDLKATILSLGAQTGRGPAELAEGFYQIASAGLSGAVALDVLKASAQAATIGLGDTNTVADITTSVLNAYGTSAGNAFQVTNTLAEAVRIAKGEASEFAPVIGRLLPVAKNLGIGFSDVAGSLALLTRNGLSASEASTQLRGLFNSFIKPSVQARKELDRVGLSSTQLLQQLQAGDFVGAITRIKTAFGNDQLGLGRLFRNQQGLNAFLTLSRDIGATADELNKVRAAGRDATREVSGFAEIKDDPVVKFKRAVADVQAELIKIGSSIAPAVVQLAKLASGFLGFFNALPSGIKFVVAAGLAIAALAGPFLIAYTAVARLTIAKKQLDLAMGNPVGTKAAAADVGRLGQVLGGQVPGILKFAGALGVLAAVAGSFQIGQSLASASSGGEKLGAVLGIAGSALGAFVAGSAAGGPIVGGFASAATIAAGAIGFFGERAKQQQARFDGLRDSLVGAKDAAEELERFTSATNKSGIVEQLRGALKGDKLGGNVEFRQLLDAGINFREFGKAIIAGGTPLEDFVKRNSTKVATVQLRELNAEIAKGPKVLSQFADDNRKVIGTLEKLNLIKFNDVNGKLLVSGITSQGAAIKALANSAGGDLTRVAAALGIPIKEAEALTRALNDVSDGEQGVTDNDPEPVIQGFGTAADGAAISIQDLATALDDAVQAATDLNNAKLDAFAQQAATAAGLADLFDIIDKNKDVLPHLGDQFDLTTEAGRKQAKAADEVEQGLKKQFEGGQARSLQILQETGNVDKAKEAYFGFLSQIGPVAQAAGVSADQWALILAGAGADFQSFTDTFASSGATAAAAAKSAIDGLLGAIPADAAAAVQAIKEPSDQVAALANQISLLPDSKITEVFAQVTNADTVDQIAEVVQDLPTDKQVAVLAAVQGKPELQGLIDQIVSDLPDEKVAEAIVNTTGQTEMDNLITSVTSLPQSRIAKISALVDGTDKVQGLKDKLDGTKGKEVFVKATTSGQPGVDALRGAVDKLHDKSITVTTRFNNIQQGAGLKIIGRNPDGSPIFGRSGMHFGPGGIRKMAAGGVITGIARQPMIVKQRAAQGILWGEPETMGEAYISYARRFRARNRQILARVASDFGMTVIPRRAASGMVIERRAAGGGGIGDAALNRLADAVTQRQRQRGDSPLIGSVTIETQAQTPAAFAVEAVGALGARLADRLADRGAA